jgi:transposase InsO family protein
LIARDERQMAMALIDEAMAQGARQAKACEVVGIASRSFQRWQNTGLSDRRQVFERPPPANKLDAQERQAIIAMCNTDEFGSQSPKQIVPTLADRGIYLASESTFYRVLRAEDMLQHRGRSRPPTRTDTPMACVASAANQVWSWDITYLASTVKGCFFYLYLFMDIYSRKIVGWEVYDTESSEQAAQVLRKTRLAEAVSPGQEVILHADNGSPMKGATMLATMQKLGVVPSFSRPAVSNDNAYSEALFKTLKYVPGYPTRPFADIEATRQWVMQFVQWYNHSHRHSGLKYVTPVQRHEGRDIEILAQRIRLYEAAKQRHPQRWSGKIRNWKHEPVVSLNPMRDDAMKKAA